MTTITEDHVSFEIAKLLKEKGFDEPTTGTYYKDGAFEYLSLNRWNSKFVTPISAPTLQMACRWLTAAHNLFITFELDFSDGAYPMFDAVVYNLATCEKYPIINYDRYSYIKGTEAAIKYCLVHLI